MRNQETIKQVIQYIKGIMEKNHLTYDDVSDLCSEKGPENKVSKKTIYNMLTRPSSTTISTLLKVCDALEIDLQHIFHTLERTKNSEQGDTGRLIYNVSHPAFLGYAGYEYNMYFFTTKPDNELYEEEELVHGSLSFDKTESSDECHASLTIDSGDFTRSGEPFMKHYDGQLVYSTNGIMFCQLISQAYGDMGFLVFEHRYLNNTPLSCVLGCAVTSSSGRNRYPSIHRFCLCNKEQYPVINDQTKEYMKGILRVKNDKILISSQKLEEYVSKGRINDTFKRNLEAMMQIMPTYYAIPKNTLGLDIPQDEFATMMEDLCEHSDLERVYHVRPEDNRHLLSILKGSSVKRKRRAPGKSNVSSPEDNNAPNANKESL